MTLCDLVDTLCKLLRELGVPVTIGTVLLLASSGLPGTQHDRQPARPAACPDRQFDVLTSNQT